MGVMGLGFVFFRGLDFGFYGHDFFFFILWFVMLIVDYTMGCFLMGWNFGVFVGPQNPCWPPVFCFFLWLYNALLVVFFILKSIMLGHEINIVVIFCQFYYRPNMFLFCSRAGLVGCFGSWNRNRSFFSSFCNVYYRLQHCVFWKIWKEIRFLKSK